MVVQHFCGNAHSCHGPDHWKRVLKNGVVVARHSGANIEIVKLFALFHDSCRLNDGYDPEHGLRGAELALSMHGEYFQLSDPEIEQLYFACQWHTDEKHHADATIGTCWDADRLDLGRVGMTPDEEYMSTLAGRKAARLGGVGCLAR